MVKLKRSKKLITYHGRSGHPVIHFDKKKKKKFIMVRKTGGGTKRLYAGSKYKSGRINEKIRKLVLK